MNEELQFYCDMHRHLVCVPYTINNLHNMARLLDIKRCWFHSSSNPHYDIPKRRTEEISAKCTIISTKDILKICHSNKSQLIISVNALS